MCWTRYESHKKRIKIELVICFDSTCYVRFAIEFDVGEDRRHWCRSQKIEYNMNERCRRLKCLTVTNLRNQISLSPILCDFKWEWRGFIWRFFIVAKTMRWEEKMKMKTLWKETSKMNRQTINVPQLRLYKPRIHYIFRSNNAEFHVPPSISSLHPH